MKKIVIIFLFMGALTTNAQTDKSLKDLSPTELKKEAKKNPEAQVLMGEYYRLLYIKIDNQYREMIRKFYPRKEETVEVNKLEHKYYVKSTKYYAKAAKQNLPKAQYWLGMMKGIDGYFFTYKDWYYNKYGNFLNWLKLSADQNLPEAQLALGNLFKEGSLLHFNTPDVKKDINKALEYFQKAAEQNCPEAQFELAMIYKLGEGEIKQNLEKYDFWIFKAANNNYYKAQNDLADSYLYGHNKNQDLNQALIWAKKGYENLLHDQSSYKKFRSFILDDVKKAIYEDNRNKEAEKKGEKGIAELKEKRAKEISNELAYFEQQKKIEAQKAEEYREEMRIKTMKREAEKAKDEQASKWAQADQQRSLNAQYNKIQQGYREINAISNPNSIDAINLGIEKRVQNTAFYEAVEREKIEKRNNSHSTNSSLGNSSGGNSSSTNSSSEIASNNSSNNSSSENKPKTRLVTQIESNHGYSFSELEGCNAVKSYVDEHIKMYNAKLKSLSICKCRDVTIEQGPDGHNPIKTKFKCEVEAVYEIPVY